MRRAAPLLAALLVTAAGPADAAPERARVEFRFADPAIEESSGLVVRDGLFVTTNDSGDTGRVFTVDPATGETVGVTDWTDDAVDVEALAPAGRGAVWVADIGDNDAERASVSVTRVPVGRGDRTVRPPTYELVYPGGPADAETLMLDPRTRRLVVVTKGIFGGRVLLAPRRLDPDGPTRLREVGTVLGIATDGAFFPDGRHVVVRDYGSAVVYTWPGLDEVADLRLPDQPQGEGLAVGDDGTLFLSTEGAGTAVLRVPLPPALRRVVVPPPPPDPTPSPTPGQTPGQSTTDGPDAASETPPMPVPDDDRPAWPWLLGGGAGLVALVLLLVGVVRRARPRG
ncbi:hypothetical protein GCM10023340_12590 [Nocardioides marinquilinus]|uniref:WD40 repeat domain-containing protein n=1 Tax=Nocardioides marinquilinus TaxID=1210400 RepID=A0ABP9PD33_9ACTN